MTPTDDAIRFDAIVRGKVQGVGFRYSVLAEASRLGLVGWVANETDGSVRCVAEGPRAQLDALLDMLREGPRGAWVGDVAVTWGPAAGAFDRFSVRSGGHRGD
jgi:acylphosphatase